MIFFFFKVVHPLLNVITVSILNKFGKVTPPETAARCVISSHREISVPFAFSIVKKRKEKHIPHIDSRFICCQKLQNTRVWHYHTTP